jgi:L-amino acid N-acyltransferase YncA
MTASIRLATKKDAAQVQAIYSPVVTQSAASFELEPPGVAEMRKRITETLGTYPWLVCERKGQLLGYVYARAFRTRPAYQWSVETSVYVHPELRRSGIGRALYTSLLKLLAMQGYYNAFAGITLPNQPSVGLHEALGFKPVGIYHEAGFKMGTWHDVGWWQIALQPKASPPRPPVDLKAAQGMEGWSTAMRSGERLLQI